MPVFVGTRRSLQRAVAFAPVNIVLPGVPTGTAVIGATLTSPDTGTWIGTPDITYARQWFRADPVLVGGDPVIAGGDIVYTDAADIAGETASTYVLTVTDVGKVVGVRAVATNAVGSASARSFVAPSVIWSPQVDIDLYGGWWFKVSDLANGAVASFASHEGMARTLVQATGSAQPVKGSGKITFDGDDKLVGISSTNIAKFIRRGTLPDSSWGNSADGTGKGFICTGICRKIGSATRYIVVGHGDTSAAHDASGPWEPSLMEVEWLPGQNPTKITEVRLSVLIPGIKSCQGITADTVAGTYWFASASEPTLRNVYEINWGTGALTGRTIATTFAPNGVASIDAEDAMWVTQNPSDGGNWAKFNRSTGAVIVASASSAQTNQDMLLHDAATGGLLMTKGANGVPGVVQVFATSGGSTAAPINVGAIVFDSHFDCPEGGIWDGTTFIGVSDGHFHAGADGLNQICEYRVVPPMANTISVHIRAQATTVTSDCFLEIGGGTDGPLDGFGIGIYPITATTLTVAVNTAASGSTQRAIINGVTVPSMASADRRITVTLDRLGSGLLTLFVDGVQIATASLSPCVGGVSLANQLTLGGSIKAATPRFLVGSEWDGMVICGPSNRVKNEAYLATL